jgi:hypothetical protein
MRRLTRALAAGALALAFCASGARAQEGDGYEPLTLPGGWEKVEYADGANIGRVEYVYNDRSEGLLKVKRTRVTAGEGPEQIAEREHEQTLRFLPGYQRGRTEPFAGGNHTGIMTQFDFTRAGKPMLGRHYYLKGDDSTVWVLQFTGDRTILGKVRNMTDQIARSFKSR